MDCGQQINHSNKSEMTKEQMNKHAVETDQPHLFQTTASVAGDSARTMSEVMKTNKADLGMYSMMWAEEYDSARWWKARAEYLQKKVWEMEEQMKFLDADGVPCDRCNEPVCYDGNEGKISTRDEAIICSECFDREVGEDRRQEESEESEEEDSEDSDEDKMNCERCAREEKEGEEFKDYGGDYMCPECITEMEDSCDCCVKGWSKANEFGRCTCRCACGFPLRNCRYECAKAQ